MRFCGPARIAFRWRGTSYVFRGGSCYRDDNQAGINIGLLTTVNAAYPDRGFFMWWQPPGRAGHRVKVAESSIQLHGVPEYAGDGTVLIGPHAKSGTFALVGRNMTRFPGKRVTGRFTC
jgi:hypothetical protein